MKNFAGEQKNLRHQRLFFGIILIFLTAFLGLLIWWRKDILGTRPFEGKGRFNIIIDTNPLLLLSISPGKEGVVVVIPYETYVDVPFGYGPYKAGSVYPLGELDPKKGGGVLLSQTIQNVFGLPIESYIVLPKHLPFNMAKREDFINFKKELFNIFRLLGQLNGIKTNLTYPELLRLWLIISRLRSDQFKFFNLDKFNILEKINLVDGTPVLKIDPDKLDKTLEGMFSEEEILKENISLTVLNGTTKQGIGTNVARIISNIGGRVVAVGNNDEKISERCDILGNPKQLGSKTSERIAGIFSCKMVSGSKVGNQSDLVIILGEDFVK